MNTSRRVIKAVKLLGGAQVAQMLFTVVRTKCLALWLGSAGVGLFGLYNQAIEMLSQLSQLNIRESGVRTIASRGAGERVVALVGSLSGMLGIAGALLTLLLAPVLGRLTFGEEGHAWPFVVLSVVVFLRVLVAGRQAILQATDGLRFMATAALWGNMAGTVVSIALFRLLGMDGILPSLVVFAVVTAAAYFLRSSGVKPHSLSPRETLHEGLPTLKLGGYMTAAMFMTSLASYLFLAWLRSTSTEESVGLYQAGFTVVSQYVGILFSAVAVEFYPRVTRVVQSRVRTSTFVAHEVCMLQWALLGCVAVMVVLSPLIVRLLYAESFAPVATYIAVAAVGTSLRAYSVGVAYVILARGDGRVYLITEGVSAALYLILNIVGYCLWGLVGAALAYVVWYLAYSVSVTVVYRWRYNLAMPGKVLMLTVAVTASGALQACLCLGGSHVAAIVLAVVLAVVSVTVFYKMFISRRVG